MVDTQRAKYIYLDGRKAVTLSDLDGFLDYLVDKGSGDVGTESAWGSVPWVYRGIKMRAQAVAAMPFHIYRGETLVDEYGGQANYENNNGIETPGGLQGVWIDVPLLELIHGEGYVSNHFGAEYRTLKRFDIDISKEPVLVYPTIHFQNGGIDINNRTETNVPGLFAAGEVTGGVHGKNRLGGNALTEYMVFGRRAGVNAAEHVKKARSGRLTLDHVKKYQKTLEGMMLQQRAPILLPDYRGKDVLSKKLELL